MNPRRPSFSVATAALSLVWCQVGCVGPEPPLSDTAGYDENSKDAEDAGQSAAAAVTANEVDDSAAADELAESMATASDDGPTQGSSEGDAVVPETTATSAQLPRLPSDGTLPLPDDRAATASAGDGAATNEASVTPEPTYETVRFHVDHYMQACSSWEGQLFCHRVSEDSESWFLDYELFLYFFRWGFTYVVDGHFEEKTKDSGEVVDVFKVDDIVSEVQVEPLTRFDLDVDPTYSEQGKLEHIAVYSAGGRVVGGSITTRPLFFCYPEACEALGEKIAGDELFVVTFEYNAFMRLFVVEIDGQVVQGLPDALTQRLRADWEESEPASYVVRDCTEDAEPVCTLAVIDGGSVVSIQTRTGSADWTNVELVGDERGPIDRQFEHLAHGEADSLIYDFQIDGDYHYVSRVDYGVQGSSNSHTIDCFVADSVDPDACLTE